MRKALVASIALVTITFAGGLIAAPKMPNKTHQASISSPVIDIAGLTREAGSLPDQSYPAH